MCIYKWFDRSQWKFDFPSQNESQFTKLQLKLFDVKSIAALNPFNFLFHLRSSSFRWPPPFSFPFSSSQWQNHLSYYSLQFSSISFSPPIPSPPILSLLLRIAPWCCLFTSLPLIPPNSFPILTAISANSPLRIIAPTLVCASMTTSF